jgi:hypothetical protein
MKWITREHPKIDRIACPWLIKRFIDKEAEFIYAPETEVLTLSKKLHAIPFDIPDVEFTHYDDQCTFDYFIKKYKISDPAVQTMALIIRGADTDKHYLTNESSGLWAISAGLAYNIRNDHQLLEKGMLLYDALYSWAKFLQKEHHTQHPTEKVLLEIYNKFIKQKSGKKKKTPSWVNELKELIQDQVDTNFALNLSEVSKGLKIHPAYLSRKFSKYFNNLTFGEYLRKLRIQKAVHLIENTNHSLTEIAYLTGFSDQSHFTRVFKKHTGKNPSSYKKQKKR